MDERTLLTPFELFSAHHDVDRPIEQFRVKSNPHHFWQQSCVLDSRADRNSSPYRILNLLHSFCLHLHQVRIGYPAVNGIHCGRPEQANGLLGIAQRGVFLEPHLGLQAAEA